MLKLRVVSSLLLLIAVVGCRSVESGDVETSDMNVGISVNADSDGKGASISVGLSDAALAFIDLDGDDKLTAKSGNATVDLAEGNLLGVFAYTGALGDVVAGDEVTVGLVRSEGKAAAPASVVVVPAPLTIEAPAVSASFSRADDDIVVSLGGADDDNADSIEIKWEGDCIDTGSLEVAATQKSATIAKGSIKQLPDDDDAATAPLPTDCAMKLTATRIVDGTLDAAFKGGAIHGRASVSRDLATTP